MKIFGVVSTLLLASNCWAAPQEKKDSGALDGLIDQVLNSNQNQQEKSYPNQPIQSTTSIDDLISSIFNPNNQQQGGNIGQNTNSDDCECVPYYQCMNGTISSDGVGIIDFRLKGVCDNYLDVCCAPPDVRTPEEKITPAPNVRKGCGQRNPDGVGFRIIGAKDNEAQFGEFPWMVAILKSEVLNGQNENVNVYQCGGALIHPRVVLTAGHCVINRQPSQLKIRAGEWDTQTKNEVFPHQDRDVQNIIVHEKYHSGALYNDFGLLILSQPVDVTADNVDIVCLPQTNDNFDYTRCYASGWGKDIFGKEGHYQVILKRVELPVVPHDQCQTSLRTTRLGKYFILDRTFICAGGEPGKDTCKGDGGSPLVCPIKSNPSRYAQAGIVSWGIGCGENQVPGVYANVAAARYWIDQQMLAYGLDTSEYTYRP